jgi:hypothetical protein
MGWIARSAAPPLEGYSQRKKKGARFIHRLKAACFAGFHAHAEFNKKRENGEKIPQSVQAA